MQEYQCKNCQKVFKAWRYQKRQYCSQLCHSLSKRRIAKCPVCGKEKILQKSKPQKDYCSIKCWGVAHRVNPDYECGHCKKIFRSYNGKNPNKYCSKICFDESKTLPREEFLRRRTIRVKEYRKLNPERTVAWKQKRRALELNAEGHFTSQEWIEMKKRFNQKCALCKQSVKLTVDHIKPLSKGGTNKIENIQPLCMPCNSRKSTKI